MNTMTKLFTALSILMLISCSSSSGSGDTAAPVWSVEMDFFRIENAAGLDPFVVNLTILRDGTPTAGLQPTISLQRGSASTITDQGDGSYFFQVTPTQTGEHEVTVSYESTSITRTPLVLKSVHADWNQPMAVAGLVNTAGYEDGVTITPDGQYLFVQTGPQYFSAYFVYLESRANGGCGGDRLLLTVCRHLWLDTLPGPYTAPERPGFFDGRFSGTDFLHNSNAWGIGIDQAPIFAYATMFYGFKKQPDGSFAEPFYIAFDDLNDAIASPFGMSFRMNTDGSATVVFAHNDGDASGFYDHDNDNNAITADVDSSFDVYTIDITPGQNTNLGTYTIGQPPIRDPAFFPSEMIDLGKTGTEGIYGTQGNPHLYVLNDGSVHSIWTDDEYDVGDNPGDDSDAGFLSVYTLSAGTFPNGTWEKTVLPNTVINTGPMQRQPYFSGQGLFYTQDVDIRYSAYNGNDTATDYANDTNWGIPVTILEKDLGDTPLGKIIAIGEPTVTDDNESLYFVYGYVRSVDPVTGISDINMQAGFIERRKLN
ncbi:MAG: hypothetical protein IMF15_05775 [Proteobacteria bacterium]|nr:hypothetical protein [Pseudomonadota bacterium]